MATMMANAGLWKNRQNNFGNNNTAMTNYEPQHPRGPPVNPRANYYLVVCYVCQEMAKPNQEHSLHYGGIVCFSCRAFFRRAHQKTKNPNFVCKRGGTCVVTVSNRRRCQKCRHVRCINAGMTPDAVLTEDQKVIRFRKTLMKRRQESGPNEQTVGSGEDEGEEAEDEDENMRSNDDENMRSINSISPALSFPTTEDDILEVLHEVSSDSGTDLQLPKKIPRLEELIENLSSDDDMNEKKSTKIVDNFANGGTFNDTSQNNFTNDNVDNVKISDDSTCHIDNRNDNSSNRIDNSSNIPQKFRSKIESIDRALQMTFMQMKSAASDQLMKKLGAIQAGDDSVSIGKSEILGNIVQISELFRHFALLQRQFGRLNKTDQRLLLARNTPLYIQMCLGMYLGASNYQQQFHLMKIYDKLVSQQTFDDEFVDKIRHNRIGNLIDLQRFNRITRLFKPGADLDHYSQLICQMKSLNHFTCQKFRAVLVYALIFDFDDYLNLTNANEVRESAEQAQRLLEECCEEGVTRLDEIKAVLAKMAVFCAYNIAWDEPSSVEDGEVIRQDDLTFARNLVMDYTNEEESWLEKQFKQIDDAFRSVTIGDEIVNEFFMYSLGVPLSRKYMKGVISVTMERMWRVLNIHPEFKELPSQTQRGFLSANGASGVAVMICRYESCPRGMQQIQEGFGEIDEIRWRENYLPTFKNVEKVRKLRMKDAVSDMSVRLSSEQMSEYIRIINFMSPLVQHHVLYKLIMLLVLLKPAESVTGLVGLQSTYMALIRRRTEWMCRNEKNWLKNVEMKTMVDKMVACVDNLERLSTILLHILNNQ